MQNVCENLKCIKHILLRARSYKSKKNTVEIIADYCSYFELAIRGIEKSWTPQMCTISTYIGLLKWMKGKQKKILFAVSMMWREPLNHDNICYFCTINISGSSKKDIHKIKYSKFLVFRQLSVGIQN